MLKSKLRNMLGCFWSNTAEAAKGMEMLKIRLLLVLLISAMVFSLACSKAGAPGAWVTLDTGTGDAFYSANFVSESVGWINGQSGRSYEPPEGNENANKTAKPGQKVVDPLKANQGFEVLQTTDSGQTWHAIADQFKNKIRSVWFVDPQQGWALTIDRNILHTSDGGATWLPQRKAGTVKLKVFGNRRQPEMEQPEQIDNIRFIDANHGWAWGGGRKDDYSEQPGIFLTTTDGGQNWNDIPFPFDQPVLAIFFLNKTHAWASTEGSFYRTTDGGVNWAKLQTKLPELAFNSLFFIDENNGWAVGRSGRIAKSADGGRTWTRMWQIKDEFVMRDIFFADRNHGWAVGEDGAILYTSDGDTTWINVGAPIPAKLMDVVFVNNRAGWAVGLRGTVLRYEPK
jgi:photosystem II stability/assembly factor-like uncharacterized protein